MALDVEMLNPGLRASLDPQDPSSGLKPDGGSSQVKIFSSNLFLARNNQLVFPSKVFHVAGATLCVAPGVDLLVTQ